MPPTLRTVATFEEFSLVVDCMWESYADPYNPFLGLIVPIKEPTAEGVATAVRGMKNRFWESHKADRDSFWVYIVDEDDHGEGAGKVLAGANWLFHEASPFGEKKDRENGEYDNNHGNKGNENGDGETTEEEDISLASWWPEGEAREFVKAILSQVFGMRATRMTRPHAQLSMMFTLPDHRGRGYGSLLMEYGMSKISEMDVEALVEATADGISLYEKYGLRTIHEVIVDTTYKNGKPGFIWRKMAHECKGNATWWMWKPRPSDGILYTPEMELPWEKKEESLGR
ncbi:similar to GNAT family acetyltransferase [Botrytis cinerea T4]|uniref:Similar to GNAT family acetyltransferase n=1 Tax=Botryotinia fuckeliana (strain T4) TaxID=999810 RepID=G2YBB9_BOTF4|nr:similar to GNAT family acetyltransferase [Botrytis cinerea T4]